VSGFYKNNRRMIAVGYQRDTLSLVNIAHTEYYGGNMALTAAPKPGLVLRGNYSYMALLDNKVPGAFYHRPAHYLTGSVTYRTSFYRDKLKPSVTLAVHYQSAAQSYDVENGQEKELAGFTVTNLLCNLQFMDMIIFYSVENIFDQPYAYVYGCPMPGRQFRMGVRWEFWN
jgi:outer membrane receptor protein involved in Fe transport